TRSNAQIPPSICTYCSIGVHSRFCLPYTAYMKQLIPDELSAALSGSGQELSRPALEAIALEAYRERKLTAAQLRRILGFETRYQLDGFLKEHEVWLDYTWQDLEQDRKTHCQLGL